MAKQPKKVELPADHPLIRAGFVHEIDVMLAWGYAWGTWQDYRMKIRGRTMSNGRWYLTSTVQEWFLAHANQKGNDNDEPGESKN